MNDLVELYVTMPDGSVWAVPARLVAEDRAAHYAAGGPLEEFKAQRAEVLSREREDDLIDWAKSNMNWSDVAASARKVALPPVVLVDFQEGWVNGEMQVVRP